jgi:hypothetical protein
MNDRPSVVDQTDVNALLGMLQQVLQQINNARLAVAPLETGLAMAYNDYQNAVGRLYRQTNRLQIEIDMLRARINGIDQDTSLSPTPDINEVRSEPQGRADPEAVEKDILLEHLVRMLDPMVNSEDAEFLANLQGLCNNPTTQLVDALEKIPWGIVWTTRGPQEDLVAQYRRLGVWEQALARQLSHLERENERLRKDSRYGLWEQFQRGPTVWQQFLQRTAQQQQEYNVELTEELRNLQDEWARILDNT